MQIQQNTPEWLALRKNKIGSSDAAIILGVSPYKTPYQLWCQKLGLEPEQTKTAAMQRGIDLEPIARQEASRLLNVEFMPDVVVKDWQIASLDGISSDRTQLLEIKCPGKIDHEMAMDGVIPSKYIPQLIHLMYVVGVQSIYYFSYSETSSKMIQFNQIDIELEKLLPAEKEFWDRLQNLEAPSLTEKDYISKDDDLEWMLLTDQWKYIRKQKESLEAQEDMLRDKLIDLSSGKNCIGNGIKIQRLLRKGSVDYKSMPQLSGVDIEPYRKAPIEYWRVC